MALVRMRQDGLVHVLAIRRAGVVPIGHGVVPSLGVPAFEQPTGVEVAKGGGHVGGPVGGTQPIV